MKSSRIWDFWAGHYERLWVQKWSLKPTREAAVEELKRLYQEDETFTLLDVGCGVGELLEEIHEAFPKAKVYGLDYSIRMTEKSQKRVPEGIICHLAVEELEIINKTIFPEEFDVILCTHSFPYYKDQQQILKLFYRRLAREGRLILAFASESTFYDRRVMPLVKLTTGNAAYPSKEKLRRMTRAHFTYEMEGNVAKHPWMPTLLFAVLKKQENHERHKDECHKDERHKEVQ